MLQLYQVVEVLLVEQPLTRFNKGSTQVRLSLPRKMSRVRVSSPALCKPPNIQCTTGYELLEAIDDSIELTWADVQSMMNMKWILNWVSLAI
jgi:hypothetical protein